MNMHTPEESATLKLSIKRFKTKARRKMHYALRKGILVKAPCDVCGSVKNLEAHHPDYSEPLTVLWLCQRHHIQLERAIRKPLLSIDKYDEEKVRRITGPDNKSYLVVEF